MSKQHSSKLAVLLIAVLSVAMRQVLHADTDAPPAGPRIVMIIRHAEKPEKTNGTRDPNLAPQGYKRAEALATVIPANFARPDFLIATRNTESSARPVETITPLSNALHEEIDSTFKDEEVTPLAHQILTDPKFNGKVVLIAWHHEKIPDLAKALGVTDAPAKWDPKVFDRVWKITFIDGVVTWKDLPQKALPSDARQ
jgi:phosphohistidine phosphatase SixA